MDSLLQLNVIQLKFNWYLTTILNNIPKDYLKRVIFPFKICQHSWDTRHIVDFNNAKIIIKTSKQKIKV